MFQAFADPALETSAKTSAKLIAFVVLDFVFIVLPIFCRFASRLADCVRFCAKPHAARYLTTFPLEEGISSGGAKYRTGFTPSPEAPEP